MDKVASGTKAQRPGSHPMPEPARFALFSSLRGYRPAWAGRDLAAGLAIASVGLPSAIAYPAIAGLPRETGIYASIAAAIGYAVLGPSRRLIIGPDAATVAVLAGVLANVMQAAPGLATGERVAVAALIALLVGGICLVASWLRLGNLATLLSRPVLVGFFVGVAISIITGQIGRATGLKIASDGLVAPLTELWQQAGAIHLPSLVLFLTMFAILQLSRRYRLAVPGPLIVVVLALVLSAVLDFGSQGIALVGPLPSGWPDLTLPELAALPFGQIVLGAGAVFAVSFGAGIITARSFAERTGDEVNPNAELAGFGAANLVSGLMGGFPVTASDSRTAVNLSIGGRTQAAGLAAAATLAATLALFGNFLQLMPIPALAAILIAAAVSVIDLDALRQIWRISPVEFAFALIALGGAIGFGLLQGVVVAMAATFVHVTMNAMQTRVVLLGRLPGRPGFYKLHRNPETRPVAGMVIAFIQGSLLFYNADHVRLRLLEIIATLPPDTRWLVIEASAISQVDSTALAMLEKIRAELQRRGIVLAVSDLQSDVASMFARAGLARAIGAPRFFDELDDAVAAFAAETPQPVH